MALSSYRSKRNFKATPEPAGAEPEKQKKKAKSKADGSLRFVIQLHDASRKHYDLRLELDGAMKSWALPKGPSLNPMDRRLAVEVEDHPMEYNEFEGTIPAGNYGAGTVMIWDEGSYTARAIEYPAKDAQDALRRGYAKGHMTFLIEGEKLKGEFALIRLAKGDGHQWLLVKKHDKYASRIDITHEDRSVRSGRTLGEIASSSEKEGKVWRRAEAPKSGAAELSASQKKTVKKPKAEPQAKTKPRTEKPARTVPAKKTSPKPKTPRAATRQPLAPRFRKQAEPDASCAWRKLETWRPQGPVTKLQLTRGQVHYDGYRAQVRVSEDGKVEFRSRSNLPLGPRFPQLRESLSSLPGPILLDAVIVPLDDEGKPRARGRAGTKTLPHYALYLYDLLSVDGCDLSGLPLEDRLKSLAQLQIEHDFIHLAPLKNAAADPDEALVLRHPTQAYGAEAWIAKHQQRGPAPQRAETAENQEPGSIHRVIARKGQARSSPQLSLTNRQKIYWPQDGITKGQLLDFYQYVAPLMVPHLRDRPQSLHRQPNGIDKPGFFQKEVSGQLPGWMQTATITSGRSGQSVTYALCQTETDLLCLANLGCIEINPWLSRIDSINSPDYVVFDLDPGAISFDAIVDVALVLRRILEDLGAQAFCKTSGSRGLHLYVPISGAEVFDEARLFAHQLSQLVHARLGDTTSLERSPSRRSKLIYLDYLQNRIGQTMAAIYSVRPKPHATVSTPLRWNEVKHGLDPSVFTIQSLPKRLDKLGDLWASISKAAVSISQLQAALGKLIEKEKAKPQTKAKTSRR